LHAAERNPGARIVLIEAHRLGWAASGRNGGFVESSLTHGAANGKSRWPEEFDHLERLGEANLEGMQRDIETYGMKVEWERTGMLTVATEPHQAEWLHEAAGDGEGEFLDQAAVRAEVNSPTYRAGMFSEHCAIVHPARLVMELARKKGVAILPIDSEHSAIFQAMQSGPKESITKIVLTGSGGPFRGKKAFQLEQVTVEEALKHPTWQMGPKISIDSATLMNKALEVIEARWLFDLDASQIEVILHPESMIHSFVEFADGSVMAQASPPDMRLPIQYALTYPERVPGPTRKLDWQSLKAWHFEQPDLETFPALKIGLEVARMGGTCGAVLNAANEVAVERFLKGELAFLDIARAARTALDHHNFSPTPSLADLFQCDRWARQEIIRWTSKKNQTVQAL
jgi:hypothetical protein